MQACKPGSVSRVSEILIIYLVLTVPSGSIGLPTPISGLTDKNGHSFYRGLFDLSTRKVYPAPFITVGTVGSYPTFSLSPQSDRIGSWLHFFCGTFCHLTISSKVPPLSRGTLPDVARTFLPDVSIKAIRRLALHKINEIGGMLV